ncbi:hypothetical protein GCM10008938_37830 [Deinococcus roseus]|uniref:Uncharacterized protein n=1 Tax=Deinococcus roseus TaxID=392414 RepID=A0ABQ2D6Y7_9DEIO|nr:hypothetical protein GCM10008938_37830 [Deinococcus roseus]
MLGGGGQGVVSGGKDVAGKRGVDFCAGEGGSDGELCVELMEGLA